PDDRGVASGPAGRRLRCSRPQQVRQHQTAHAEGADLEEVATGGAVAVGSLAGTPELEHGSLLCIRPRVLTTTSRWQVGVWLAVSGGHPPSKHKPPPPNQEGFSDTSIKT